MKLATYKDGSRDGQLIVVSRDLKSAHYATGIASHLQQVLDDWNFLSPQLQDLYDHLNQGRGRHAFAFDPRQCMAPLPRAYQWVRGAAYGHHFEMASRFRQADLPAQWQAQPQLCHGASDELLGPCDDVVVASEALGVDFEAGLAVVTGDVPRGVSPQRALEGIRLAMLVSDIRLRQLEPEAWGVGLCPGVSAAATAFSPVAVTLDELGEAWQGGRLDLTLQVSWNGRRLGLCEAGAGMTFHFGELIAHLCKTRAVRAGSLVGSGVVSNPGVADAQGRIDWPKGHACIAEKRYAETLQSGVASTGFMKFGDTVRIEVKGRDGQSLWGAIDQEIVAPTPP